MLTSGVRRFLGFEPVVSRSPICGLTAYDHLGLFLSFFKPNVASVSTGLRKSGCISLVIPAQSDPLKGKNIRTTMEFCSQLIEISEMEMMQSIWLSLY